jgi:hypothetical protein
MSVCCREAVRSVVTTDRTRTQFASGRNEFRIASTPDRPPGDHALFLDTRRQQTVVRGNHVRWSSEMQEIDTDAAGACV